MAAGMQKFAYKMASGKVSQNPAMKWLVCIFLAEHSTLSALAAKHSVSFNRPCVVPGGIVRELKDFEGFL